jgi:hypothetical protein
MTAGPIDPTAFGQISDHCGELDIDPASSGRFPTSAGFLISDQAGLWPGPVRLRLDGQ